MNAAADGAGPARLVPRLLDGLSRGCALTGAAALGVIVFAYAYEVAARYLFNAPTEWAHDLVGYLLSAVVFLVAPDVARSRGHVAIAFLVERMSGGAQQIAVRALAGVAALTTATAGTIVAGEALRQFERGIVTIAVHPIPKWWITGLIAAGLVLTAAQFLRLAVAPDEREG
ncbi:MAG: TRAP transporter small permease [Minwuiales bacterium]|nr:TRAP transporter small permease [Minwuiales bacterium]